MIARPNPNLRPSEAKVRNTFDDATCPTCGQKLWASSTTSIMGGIRPSFRNSNIAVARRFTTSSWMSGGTPFRLMIVVFPLITSSSIRVPSLAKISTSLRYSSSSIKDNARHAVFHPLLITDARDVRFPASRFGQDRYMLLDHRVDVQIDGHLMTRQ